MSAIIMHVKFLQGQSVVAVCNNVCNNVNKETYSFEAVGIKVASP